MAKPLECGKYTQHKKWSSDFTLWASLTSLTLGAKLHISRRHFGLQIGLLFVGLDLEVWKRKMMS